MARAVNSSRSSCCPHGVQAVPSLHRKHHRQRLGRAVLSLAQTLNGRIIGRIADQVITADSLDGDDLARVQGLRWFVQALPLKHQQIAP